MGRIVIVEDEADIVSIYRMTLERAGHVIVAVVSEAAGLAGDLTTTFAGADVAIVDERLGEVSGTSYLPAMRAANPALRILVATADPEALQRARAMGADEIRKKPFPLRQLREDVERLLAIHDLEDTGS